MTNTELADEIERSLDVLQPLSHGDILFSAPNAAPGCELRFSTLRQIIAALRQPSSDMVMGYEEYHDGIIGVFKMNTDGSRNLKVLTPKASEEFRAMLAAAERN